MLSCVMGWAGEALGQFIGHQGRSPVQQRRAAAPSNSAQGLPSAAATRSDHRGIGATPARAKHHCRGLGAGLTRRKGAPRRPPERAARRKGGPPERAAATKRRPRRAYSSRPPRAAARLLRRHGGSMSPYGLRRLGSPRISDLRLGSARISKNLVISRRILRYLGESRHSRRGMLASAEQLIRSYCAVACRTTRVLRRLAFLGDEGNCASEFPSPQPPRLPASAFRFLTGPGTALRHRGRIRVKNMRVERLRVVIKPTQ